MAHFGLQSNGGFRGIPTGHNLINISQPKTERSTRREGPQAPWGWIRGSRWAELSVGRSAVTLYPQLRQPKAALGRSPGDGRLRCLYNPELALPVELGAIPTVRIDRKLPVFAAQKFASAVRGQADFYGLKIGHPQFVFHTISASQRAVGVQSGKRFTARLQT